MVRNKDKLKQHILPSPRVAQRGVGGYSHSVTVPLSGFFLLRLFLYSSVHPLHGLQSFRVRSFSTPMWDLPDCSFLQGISTCSSVGSSMGCSADICSTVVSSMGCRGISAPAPGAPPAPSLTLVFAGFFLTLPPPSLLCNVFYHFLNTFSQRHHKLL